LFEQGLLAHEVVAGVVQLLPRTACLLLLGTRLAHRRAATPEQTRHSPCTACPSQYHRHLLALLLLLLLLARVLARPGGAACGLLELPAVRSVARVATQVLLLQLLMLLTLLPLLVLAVLLLLLVFVLLLLLLAALLLAHVVEV
jgi:hypothetical protein